MCVCHVYVGNVFEPVPSSSSFSLCVLHTQLIFISCGFDAHGDDPLGEMELKPEDYHWIAAELVALGKECDGAPVISVLEGGYDLK